MTRAPSKDRVYLALRDGASCRGAARTLKLNEKTVREHAADLVARGVLARGPGGKGFKKGPKAHPYETTIPTRGGKDRVGSGDGAPSVALRVHRGGYGFEVRGGVGSIPWKLRWKASGVPNYATRDDGGNRFWVVRGKGSAHRLMVQPVEEWVYDPAEVAGVRAARAERVRELAAAFVREHGLKFASDKAYEFQPVEYAAEMPGLEKFGEPGAELFWVDGSPGDGRLEAETQEPAMGKLLLEWPGVLDRLAQHERALAQIVTNEGLLIQALAPRAGPPARVLAPADDPGVA
jgi:hypothetical protein